jgi:L-lactate dehydrogenase complex protein LldG
MEEAQTCRARPLFAMTSSDRAALRAQIRAAIARSTLPGATADPPGGFVATTGAPVDLVARFAAELGALGGTVHMPDSCDAASIAALVEQLLEPTETRQALVWDEQAIPIEGLAQALEARGFVVCTSTELAHAGTPARARLAACGVGITGVDALLAETGSLVVVSGPGRGRLASLLPPVHVAVARRTQLMYSLPDLLLSRPELAVAGSNMVCITGPSRTADIEHTLSRGVHGPRTVHVVIV